eukprot:scaffold72939_cov22-Tisochrysis_lutea.AAC.1
MVCSQEAIELESTDLDVTSPEGNTPLDAHEGVPACYSALMIPSILVKIRHESYARFMDASKDQDSLLTWGRVPVCTRDHKGLQEGLQPGTLADGALVICTHAALKSPGALVCTARCDCSLHAALLGKTEAMEMLVNANADVTMTTHLGDTALHWACYK